MWPWFAQSPLIQTGLCWEMVHCKHILAMKHKEIKPAWFKSPIKLIEQFSVCMFFREKESWVAVNLLETLKYFAMSIQLASFWQIIISFSSKLNTLNSVLPFKTTHSSWAYFCSQFSKHSWAGNALNCKCSQGKHEVFGGLRWEKPSICAMKENCKGFGRKGAVQMGKTCHPNIKKTLKKVRKMLDTYCPCSPVYKTIIT